MPQVVGSRLVGGGRREGEGRQQGISQAVKYLAITRNVLIHSEDVPCSLVM